ncbi:MAG TPA: adenylate/guanylate cyclase domain-containing protein [Acidimicrobiia bacterium]|nr:adenylate/guanylate cyclase domain-containing protein [Acidimicrobiia bacterium]
MTRESPSAVPETRYADSGGVSIAYQVLGDGPIDLVFVPGFASHLEHAWQHPRLAHFYHRLASFSRLTLLDKRGTGLSDRVSPNDIPGIEQRKDDLKAVMDEVGINRAALVGVSDGGPLAMLFAATYPDRTESLVLVNTYSKRIRSDDHKEALTPEAYGDFVREASEHWGQPVAAELLAPGSANDPRFRDWWGAALRMSMSPGAARAMLEMNSAIDVRAALSAIHVPTLIVHRTGDMATPVEGGRFLAAEIEGARIVELPGDDHFPWLGDADAVLEAIEEFVTGERSGLVPNVALASMLFTDIVSSTKKAADLGDRDWTALLKTHDSLVQDAVSRFEGREVKHTGDGSLSVFEGPARGARCWLYLRDRLHDIGLSIRGGLHTSEIEVVNGDVRGLGVHIAARLMGLAAPDELIVSSVVHDLSAGSGLTFAEGGVHELKGVPGDWHVYGVTG